jgi:hypothetical protein
VRDLLGVLPTWRAVMHAKTSLRARAMSTVWLALGLIGAGTGDVARRAMGGVEDSRSTLV